MRYYVITDDGKRYGPGDIVALRQLLAEGKLTYSTILEVEGTSQRFAASQLPELFSNEQPASNFSNMPQPTWQNSQPPNYYQPAQVNPGNSLSIPAFILAGIALLIFPPLFGAAAIICANMAVKKKEPLGKLALNLSILATVLGMIIGAIVAISLRR